MHYYPTNIKEIFDEKRKTMTTLGKTPNTEWCDETKSYEPKDMLISYNYKKRLLRHGRGPLGFISIDDEGTTLVKVFHLKKKEEITTIRLMGEHSWFAVKETVFDKAINIKIAASSNNKPYKTMYRHKMVGMDEFSNLFENNSSVKKSYAATTKDKVLMSLNEILSDVSSVSVDAGTHSASIFNAHKAIRSKRHKYNGDIPAVEVFAIWSNFEPESKLILPGIFDVGQPIFYSYTQFNDEEEFENGLIS